MAKKDKGPEVRTSLTFMILPSLRAKIEEIAVEERQTLGRMLNFLLEDAVAQREGKPTSKYR